MESDVRPVPSFSATRSVVLSTVLRIFPRQRRKKKSRYSSSSSKSYPKIMTLFEL